jgi:abhydrolase domain-containing protein 12
MIMHAENDRVIPYELGYKLYRTAIDSRGKSWGPVEFHRFEQKYGHKYIVRAKSFPDTLEQFINKYKNEAY